MSDQREESIRDAIQARAKQVTDPADRPVQILLDEDALAVAEKHGSDLPSVYRASLELGICPCRYLRNRDSLSLDEQLRLAVSRVVVVGAGGLGGHVILLLARLGIGHLVVADGDVFDETNLNRQVLCTADNLGRSKADEAMRQVRAVNPGVMFTSHPVRIDEFNVRQILAGSNVVVDALDNIPDRLLLEKGAKAMGLPLVHGALAGFDGQVMTVFPEDHGLKTLYGEAPATAKDPASPEALLGVPALMPSMIATLQAMEVIKLVLGWRTNLRNAMLHVDLQAGEINRFTFG
ncbi:MAG: HesA/MoeB/ThiF family protein [Deltaproteobacteria bacterium]|nr:HesA/MoeB/ThiF family protein [Deltaproteobacteria bacterium]